MKNILSVDLNCLFHATEPGSAWQGTIDRATRMLDAVSPTEAELDAWSRADDPDGPPVVEATIRFVPAMCRIARSSRTSTSAEIYAEVCVAFEVSTPTAPSALLDRARRFASELMTPSQDVLAGHAQAGGDPFDEVLLADSFLRGRRHECDPETRALVEWQAGLARAAARTGAEMHGHLVDAWCDDPRFFCPNGHVSTRILKTETRGDRCLKADCNAPVVLGPDMPEEAYRPIAEEIRANARFILAPVVPQTRKA